MNNAVFHKQKATGDLHTNGNVGILIASPCYYVKQSNDTHPEFNSGNYHISTGPAAEVALTNVCNIKPKYDPLEPMCEANKSENIGKPGLVFRSLTNDRTNETIIVMYKGKPSPNSIAGCLEKLGFEVPFKSCNSEQQAPAQPAPKKKRP